MTAVESFDDTPVEITVTLPRCDAEGVVEVLRKAHWHQSADAIEAAIDEAAYEAVYGGAWDVLP